MTASLALRLVSVALVLGSLFAGTFNVTACSSTESEKSCSGSEHITFHLNTSSAPGAFCSGTTQSVRNTVLIKKPDGTSAGSLERGCESLCEDACEPGGCEFMLAAPEPIGREGLISVWDGTFFGNTVSCGGDLGGGRCIQTSCAAPGEYIATMCAFPVGKSEVGQGAAGTGAEICAAIPGSATPTCIDVPFTWPPANEAGAVVEAKFGL